MVWFPEPSTKEVPVFSGTLTTSGLAASWETWTSGVRLAATKQKQKQQSKNREWRSSLYVLEETLPDPDCCCCCCCCCGLEVLDSMVDVGGRMKKLSKITGCLFVCFLLKKEGIVSLVPILFLWGAHFK